MPLRVKCRCGQELVLRFNEWIYGLFGLVILCLLASGTALGIIVYKLSAIESYSRETREAAAKTAQRPESPAGLPAPPEVVKAPLPEPAQPGAPKLEPAEPKTVSSAVPSPPVPPEGAAVSSPPVPPEGAAVPSPPEGAATPPGRAGPEEKRAVSVASGGDSRPAEAEALAGPPEKPREKPASKPREKATAKTPPKARAAKVLLAGASPLERLLVVGRAEDPRLQFLFLEDQDPAVRRSVVARFLASPKPEAALRNELLALALPAAAQLLSESTGHELLQRLAGEDRGREVEAWWEWGKSALGADPRQGPSEEVLRSLAGRAESMRASFPAAAEMAKVFDERARAVGTDLLLCVDTTESMEDPLKALAGEAWLFPALAWSIPGLRMGLLLYADEVISNLPLGSDPRELARALSGLKAEGGGDVPEGVHEALKAALQLGRFDWRPEARKQIIFVGDGPPPRLEVPGLISLARECHGEAGYRIDALSVNPPDGQAATLHFPELAAAGGGRAVTAAPDRLAAEVFLSLFPPGAREELNRLLPVIAGAVAP